MKRVYLSIVVLFCLSFSAISPLNASQKVIIKGTVSNVAKDGAVAKTNIGSTVGYSKPESISQTVSVSGNIINNASGKDTVSEINIGSVIKK